MILLCGGRLPNCVIYYCDFLVEKGVIIGSENYMNISLAKKNIFWSFIFFLMSNLFFAYQLYSSQFLKKKNHPRYLATTSSDHTVKIWNVDGFSLEKTLIGEETILKSLYQNTMSSCVGLTHLLNLSTRSQDTNDGCGTVYSL